MGIESWSRESTNGRLILIIISPQKKDITT